MDTMKYATFRYDTMEVENGLKSWKSPLVAAVLDALFLNTITYFIM